MRVARCEFGKLCEALVYNVLPSALECQAVMQHNEGFKAEGD